MDKLELINLISGTGIGYFEDNFKTKLDVIWQYFVDTAMFTEDEIELVTSLNGYNEETMNDMLFVRFGYRDLPQYLESEVLNENTSILNERQRNHDFVIISPITGEELYNEALEDLRERYEEHNEGIDSYDTVEEFIDDNLSGEIDKLYYNKHNIEEIYDGDQLKDFWIREGWVYHNQDKDRMAEYVEWDYLFDTIMELAERDEYFDKQLFNLTDFNDMVRFGDFDTPDLNENTSRLNENEVMREFYSDLLSTPTVFDEVRAGVRLDDNFTEFIPVDLLYKVYDDVIDYTTGQMRTNLETTFKTNIEDYLDGRITPEQKKGLMRQLDELYNAADKRVNDTLMVNGVTYEEAWALTESRLNENEARTGFTIEYPNGDFYIGEPIDLYTMMTDFLTDYEEDKTIMTEYEAENVASIRENYEEVFYAALEGGNYWQGHEFEEAFGRHSDHGIANALSINENTNALNENVVRTGKTLDDLRFITLLDDKTEIYVEYYEGSGPSIEPYTAIGPFEEIALPVTTNDKDYLHEVRSALGLLFHDLTGEHVKIGVYRSRYGGIILEVDNYNGEQIWEEELTIISAD